jgi:hypothetical protein
MGRLPQQEGGNHRKPTDNKTPFPNGLAQPALRALASAGYDHLEQLAGLPESDVRALHGIGPNAFRKLSDALSTLGLSFTTSKSSATAAVPSNFADLWCEDRGRQGAAFELILDNTSEPVDWAYTVWDELLTQLSDKNNRNRSIAAQVLCNVAKSDPSNRMLRDFPALFDVVNDERFVTARHALQAMWKVGCVGKKHQELLVAALEKRYSDCASHKNCTLIRYDIIECLRKLFDEVHDESIRTRAMALIELETDPKYRKKYLALWRKK